MVDLLFRRRDFHIHPEIDPEFTEYGVYTAWASCSKINATRLRYFFDRLTIYAFVFATATRCRRNNGRINRRQASASPVQTMKHAASEANPAIV